MAQNISLWGANYSNVPSVVLPKQGGGTASFTDVTPTTVTSDSDVANGKIYFRADGSQHTGTNSGGGGSNWTLIASGTLTVNTTSTSAGSAGTIECGSTAWTADAVLWVRIRGQSGKGVGISTEAMLSSSTTEQRMAVHHRTLFLQFSTYVWIAVALTLVLQAHTECTLTQ